MLKSNTGSGEGFSLFSCRLDSLKKKMCVFHEAEGDLHVSGLCFFFNCTAGIRRHVEHLVELEAEHRGMVRRAVSHLNASVLCSF